MVVEGERLFMGKKQKVVVITGSSRGIGFGLAKVFLEKDCSVVISGSSEKSTTKAYEELHKNFNPTQLHSFPCDVQDTLQIQALWDDTIHHFGQVDIWINNAGFSGPVQPLWSQTPEIAVTAVNTNLTGLVVASIIALKGMLKQGFGAIYNMEGMGSDGRIIPGMAIYGTTKHGQKYFNDALSKEVENSEIIIGALRPGMVATDLILEQYKGKPEEWEKVKGIFNIISDRVENVTPWLAEKILTNKKNGVRFSYLPSWKVLLRVLMMPFSRRNVYQDFGL